MIKKLLIAAVLFISVNACAQKFDSLALTPPIGWNSWNTFQTNISAKLVKETADAMVASGMRDAGYKYLVLDDGWMAKQRDSAGNLVPDPEKFPDGLQEVIDYVHSKGLKFGLYNCAGTETCAGYPGTRGYEYQDARFYASLGIDYLKFDWCHSEGLNAKEAYTTMSKALKKAGHPIVFSLCEWGSNKPWLWAEDVGELWRTTGDITNKFEGVRNHGNWSALGAMTILDKQEGLRKYAGPGHWNDPDMLEVGNGLTESQNRAHFTMWCMLAAPLIAGNDLRNMTPQTDSILTNKEVIAIDQDSLGIEGFKYADKDSLETWLKPLENGEWAVCFLNRSGNPQKMNFNWQKQIITDSLSHRQLNAQVKAYKLHNLWSKNNIGTTKEPLNEIVPPQDVLILRLSEE